MIRVCGSENRLPGVPAVSRNCPIEAAIPNEWVATSQSMKRMVS